MSGIVDLGTNVSVDETPQDTEGLSYQAESLPGVELGRGIDERAESKSAPPVLVASAGLIRATRSHQDGPERAAMHSVLIPTAGTGVHLVDFESVPVAVGAAIHIQPGQVQQFDMASTFDGLMVVVRPDICPPGLFLASQLRVNVELADTHQIVAAVARSLVLEQERPDRNDGVMAAGARFILHHLARAAGIVDPSTLSAHDQLLLMFRAEVDARFAESRNVSVYARSIGTSTKTLARATTNLTGLAPKEIIDQRVVLEAKRLLGHSNEPIASIGEALGFSEATNFTKFFVRMTGQTPHEFRT